LFADAVLKLLEEGAVVSGKCTALISSAVRGFRGAQGQFVSIGSKGVNSQLTEASNEASIATNGNSVSDHLDGSTSWHRLSEVTDGELGGQTELFFTFVSLPGGVVVHHRDVTN